MSIGFQHRKLANGLTIIAEPNPSAHTAAVGFFVKTGARDEEAALMGVSHYLEHMMFKGTARRSADDVNRDFDQIGANYNADTSQEVTTYWAQVLPEFMGQATELISDMLRPALRESDFEMEKNVILEEISMYEDQPVQRLLEAATETHFGDHPLGYRVLGRKETVSALTAGGMRGYFEKRYAADNITVAAAGKIEFERLVDDLSRLTAQWKPSGALRRYNPPQYAARDKSVRDAAANRHYVALICPGPTEQDSRRHAAQVVADVIGDAEGSRFYWALIDPGLAEAAYLSAYPQDQVGSYFMYLVCDPERASQVESVAIKTLDGYAASIRPDEIERAKNKLATHLTLRGESPARRMRGLGFEWLYSGQYVPLEEDVARIMAVTPDHVRDLLAAFPFTPRTVVRMGPGVKGP